MLQPYYETDGVALHLGDCRQVLATMADASIDAICTDPPYELGFLGRSWDASGIAFNPTVWEQCLRVLKPGGHLLAFGGTRTYHRMVCAIEDAGFEIRDSLHWIYGSGFPKGQDIGKGIDKKRDDRADILRVTAFLSEARKAAAWSMRAIDQAFGTNGMASHWTAKANKAAAVPTVEQWERLRDLLGFDNPDMDELVRDINNRKGSLGEAWAQREVIGERHSGLAHGRNSVFLSGAAQYPDNMVPVTAPASEAARRWQGWNTALKPAHEPIVLARKSTGFNTTVANVLEHGTGALNVDGCRTAAGQDYRDKCASVVGLDSNRNGDAYGKWTDARENSANDLGRWPTNLVFTHSAACVESGPCAEDCPVRDLDRQERRGSRFFPAFRYEAKAPPSERPRLADGTAHATVKPLSLMRWLVRLITPPGGVVLDPFAGSGTTGEACVLEGFRSVLIELEQPHAELIQTRLKKPLQSGLFGGAS